jgi:hypothetical protein
MMPFSLSPPPAQTRRRRCLWASEIERLARLVADWRARDRQHQDATLAAIERQIADLRFRLVEIERSAGLADIHRAPGRGDLRRLRAG